MVDGDFTSISSGRLPPLRSSLQAIPGVGEEHWIGGSCLPFTKHTLVQINNHMEKIRVTAAAPSWRRPPPQDSRTPSPCPCLPCSHSTRCSQTGRKVETCFPCNSFWSHLFFLLSRARILLLADGGLRGRPTH